MKKIKILFQGDSITDAGRDKRNYHHMGAGYPKFVVEALTAKYPEVEFEFINLGISGNRTDQLFDRLYPDCIAFQPDIVSVLVGINDVWHRYCHKIATQDEQIETNYKCILKLLKRDTNAKIIMLQPYTEGEKQAHMRADVERLKLIVNSLADEYADAYIPLDEIFAEALKSQPEALYYSKDGVHPNSNGREFIGKLYAEAIKPIINSL